MKRMETEDKFVESALRKLTVLDVLDLVKRLRAGEPGQDTGGDSYVALSLLQRFAEFRTVDDLVEATTLLAAQGRGYDIDVLIETAAFTIPPDRVARLAIALLVAGHEGLAAVLSDQCAMYRVSRNLALFVNALLEDGYEKLADRALQVAAKMRPIGDVARLYLILQAADPTDRSEHLINAILPPVRTVEELREFSLILAHLSPHDPALVSRVLASAQQKMTAQQIADLVRALEPTEVARPFVVDVVRQRPVQQLYDFYTMLTANGPAADGQADELGDLVLSSSVRARGAEELIALATTFNQADDRTALYRLCKAIAAEQAAPLEDPAPQIALLAELTQRWDRTLHGSLATLVAVLTEEIAPELLEGLVRRLDALNAKDLALEVCTTAVCNPQRWTGPALSRLVLEVSGLEGHRPSILRPDKQKATARDLAEQLAKRRNNGQMRGVTLAEYIECMDRAGRTEFGDMVVYAMLELPADDGCIVELARLLHQNPPTQQRAVNLLVSWLRQNQLVAAARLPDILNAMAQFLTPQSIAGVLQATVMRWPQREQSSAVTVLRKADLAAYADLVQAG